MILSGDQLYRMDFSDMMRTHIELVHMPPSRGYLFRETTSHSGIMQVDDEGQVRGFVEKPQTEEELATVRMDPS